MQTQLTDEDVIETGLTRQSLDEIALGLNPCPDKSSRAHGYTEHYARHFEPWRDRVLKLLEIGVWEGASLALWSAYFPQAQIAGADIDIERCQCLPDRCRLWQVDQSSKESLVNMALHLGPWDIIVDDGSHHPAHQITTLNTLWPYLNANGIYAIEDLHPNYTAYAGAPELAVTYIGTVLQADLHGRGKTGLARWQNSPQEEQDKLAGRELELESIHLYRYLAILCKR